jgi:hypothetical protein
MTTTLAKVSGRRWTLALEWKAADAWIGAFWDLRGPLLNVWVCVLPCLPFHVQVMRARRGGGER